MLDFIRKNASSVIFKVILGIIALVFVFWGIGSFQSNRMTIIASVDGEKILYENYRIAYANAIERYQQMFKGKLPQGFLEGMNIKGQVLDSLIDKMLIKKTARQLGVRVSDEEVRQSIVTMPAFQQEGKFNKDIYEKLLRSNRLTPAQFEAEIRDEIITDKTRSLILSMVQVSDVAAADYYKFENAEKQLSYGVIEAASCIPEVNISDEELKTWHDAHKEDFKTEPQIAIRYLMLDENELTNAVSVSDNEILGYYDTHTSEFDVKEERRARHILVKIPKDATDDQQEQAHSKATALLQQLRSGESFENLAQKHSDDPGSATKGGDLGFFGRNVMVPAFEQMVFSMDPGQISEPVKTQFGWHIIKLEEIKPGGIRQLDGVRGKIETKLRKEKAKELNLQRSNEIYEKIMLSSSLDTFIKENAMPVQLSGNFTEKNVPINLGLNKETVKTLFALEKGGLSSILQTNKGMMIAEVMEKKPAIVPKLDEVREKAIAKLKEEKAETLCMEKANALLAKSKESGSFEKTLKDSGVEAKTSSFFKTSDSTAGGSLPTQVTEVGAELSNKNKVADHAVKIDNKIYMVAFAQNKDDKKAPTDEELASTKARLLRQKQESFYKDWLESLRHAHKIEINQRLLQG